MQKNTKGYRPRPKLIEVTNDNFDAFITERASLLDMLPALKIAAAQNNKKLFIASQFWQCVRIVERSVLMN